MSSLKEKSEADDANCLETCLKPRLWSFLVFFSEKKMSSVNGASDGMRARGAIHGKESDFYIKGPSLLPPFIVLGPDPPSLWLHAS